MYEKLGWHAPIVLSISVAVLDLVGRLLIVESSTLKLWSDEVASEVPPPPVTLSAFQLVKALLGSPRGITAYLMTFW